MTRYTLNIPKMIKREHVSIAWHFENESKNGTHVDESDERFEEIPKEWLTEVKEYPVSAEAYWDKYFYDGLVKGKPVSEYIIEAFKAGEQNNELRHRETFSFEDWHSKHGSSDKELDSMAWQACKESHNIK